MIDNLTSYSTAPVSSVVEIAIFNLSKKLTNKQPLGDQVVTDVASLLESGNIWQCGLYFYLLDSSAEIVSGNVPGLSTIPATLSMMCRVTDASVSFML